MYPAAPQLAPMARRSFCVAALGALLPAHSSAESPGWPRLKADIRARHPLVRQLTVTGLQDWLSDPARQPPPLLIDTRSAIEFEAGHLPGALHAPKPGDVLALLDRQPPPRRVVFYCSVGYRSAVLVQQVQRQLSGRAAPELFNLEGSIFEWANRGLPMENARGATRLAHAYDSRWGAYLERELWAPPP